LTDLDGVGVLLAVAIARQLFLAATVLIRKHADVSNAGVIVGRGVTVVRGVMVVRGVEDAAIPHWVIHEYDPMHLAKQELYAVSEGDGVRDGVGVLVGVLDGVGVLVGVLVGDEYAANWRNSPIRSF